MRIFKSVFILGFFIFLISGCGLIGKIENNTTMKEPARRKMIDAVSELRVSSKINSSTSAFLRLKGSGQMTFEQQRNKVRLDLRISSSARPNSGLTFLINLWELSSQEYWLQMIALKDMLILLTSISICQFQKSNN